MPISLSVAVLAISSLTSVAPPAAALPAAPLAADAPARAEVPASPSHRLERALFVLAPSFELASRSFVYDDPVTANLRPYRLPAAPALAVSGELYPLGLSGRSILRDVGLVGAFERTISASSATSDGTTMSSTWMRYRAGLRARIHTGSREDAPLVGVEAALASTSFDFDGPPQSVTHGEFPSVRYLAMRPALDVRVPVDRFALEIGVGAPIILSGGPMDQRFTRASYTALDARLAVAVRIVSFLEARATVSYERIGASLHPEPGDAYVAGGSLDEYLTAGLGLAAYY